MSLRNRSLPLKAAIVGLSASAVSSWAATAHLPYLLSDEGRKHYEIVALCNSSENAASRAIEHYQLPQSVKAYGDPENLANDANVDVVICNTRVDKHMETIMPSILKGKDIFVEWPVASNLDDVNEIMRAAEQHKVRVAVGLQGRWTPPVVKLKETLEKGDVGKVLSSEVHSYGGTAPGNDTLLTGWQYFADKRVGGNNVTILFGHLIDQIQHVLGPIQRQSTSVDTHIRWPTIRVLGQQKKEIMNTIGSDVPDVLHLRGTLPGSTLVVPSAPLHASYHRDWPFPGEPTAVWIITCENADLRLRAYGFPSLRPDDGKVVLTDIRWKGSGEIEKVDWQWRQRTEDVASRSQDTGYSLQAFANGSEDGWADLKSAVRLTEQIECWIDGRTW